MPRPRPLSQLDRIERNQEHVHEMQHILVEGLQTLLESGQDMARLADKAAEMKVKTDALKAAIASVTNPPSSGVK